jgi:RNA polymerase sigma-70 factor, ECF subfamily
LEPSDLDLVRSAGGGDESAFHALLDRHAPQLFRVALSLTRNRDDAEDLMQETFVGAYRGLKKFEGRASVKTWLTQILTRQAAKAWNRSRNERSTSSIHASAGDEDNSAAAAASRLRESEALAVPGTSAQVEKRLDVMDVLKKLSPPHREVLVLREIRGMSYDEIAQTLGVPRGTVESRLSRARAEFKTRFEGRDRDGEVGS